MTKVYALISCYSDDEGSYEQVICLFSNKEVAQKIVDDIDVPTIVILHDKALKEWRVANPPPSLDIEPFKVYHEEYREYVKKEDMADEQIILEIAKQLNVPKKVISYLTFINDETDGLYVKEYDLY